MVCELHRSLEVAPIIRNIKYDVGRVNYAHEPAGNNKYSNEKQNPTASSQQGKKGCFREHFSRQPRGAAEWDLQREGGAFCFRDDSSGRQCVCLVCDAAVGNDHHGDYL